MESSILSTFGLAVSQSYFPCPDDRLRPIDHLQRAEDTGDVVASRFEGEAQLHRDLLIAAVPGQSVPGGRSPARCGIVTLKMSTCGLAATISRVASMPLMPGLLMSIRITSGCRSLASRIASATESSKLCIPFRKSV